MVVFEGAPTISPPMPIPRVIKYPDRRAMSAVAESIQSNWDSGVSPSPHDDALVEESVGYRDRGLEHRRQDCAPSRAPVP